MAGKFRVGVVGCGNISGQYFNGAKKFDILEYVACADLSREVAEAKAKEFGVDTVCTVEELMANDQIDCVLNLTVPKAHADIALQAIEAGKHVYNEKPLAATLEQGRKVMAAAKERGVRVGCAPDTFLGAGHQTARKAIDDGLIGKPLALVAFMLCRGHESWHPNPEFYYEPGGGPMFDMGPYYLTDLVQLIGPIKQVSGEASVLIDPRVISHDKSGKQGKEIPVETPDHIAGTMQFDNGAVGTIITSFAVMAHTLPNIQIYGSRGSLMVPDPNRFDGEVKVRKAGDDDWQVLDQAHPQGYGRAAGLADMAHAIAADRPHRASGDVALHVLEAMQGFLDAAEKGQTIQVTHQVKSPAAVPADMEEGQYE